MNSGFMSRGIDLGVVLYYFRLQCMGHQTMLFVKGLEIVHAFTFRLGAMELSTEIVRNHWMSCVMLCVCRLHLEAVPSSLHCGSVTCPAYLTLCST
jgi:hypothetical protein